MRNSLQALKWMLAAAALLAAAGCTPVFGCRDYAGLHPVTIQTGLCSTSQAAAR